MANRHATWPINYLLLWELKIYYRVQKGSLLKPVLSQLSHLKLKHCEECLLRVIVFGPCPLSQCIKIAVFLRVIVLPSSGV